MLALIQTWRDFREFLEAKKRKREPVRFDARGAAAATYVPRHGAGFASFRAALRGVGDFGCASEQLDRLEFELRARHGCCLPLPRKVLQNEDKSLTLYWEALSVRCFESGLMSLIGGTAGIPAKKITRELLDSLAFLARIQRAS